MANQDCTIIHSDQHTSDLLITATEGMKEKDSFTLQDIIGLLKERVFGIAILLFCIPNCLPIPNVTGLSAITGIPIVIIGLEMIVGRTQLWLPAFLGRRQMPGKRLAALLERAIPYIRKTEVLLHPRLLIMSSHFMQRFLGIAFVILAIIMSLPIPFGNLLPGLAMALMAIGIIERDGFLILAGLAVGAGTIALVFTLADTLMQFGAYVMR